ncbi:hypothetical protein P20652_2558 [Pseudoalteromonas sp. BSi20652]|nr:hypothetical protein P20652_2558 [Pseudoalteromonas sp. BSi20652]
MIKKGNFSGYLGLAHNITLSKEREAALEVEKLKSRRSK